MHAAALTREDLALALSVVLLGLLMMITRRNALTQVVGFMSLENGLILAAVSVAGMPLVVELSVAFLVMVAFIVFGVFFFRIRERFESLDVQPVSTWWARADDECSPPLLRRGGAVRRRRRARRGAVLADRRLGQLLPRRR